MNPATIILQAQRDGVNLALSPAGTIKAIGNQDAIGRWQGIIREHKNGIVASLRGADLPEPQNDNRHFRWLILFTERDPVETCCLPEPTHTDVLALCPDAIAAEPLPERTRRKATPKQETELRALVASVGAAYGFTNTEQQEALALALNDSDGALMSYRALANECANQTICCGF